MHVSVQINENESSSSNLLLKSPPRPDLSNRMQLPPINSSTSPSSKSTASSSPKNRPNSPKLQRSSPVSPKPGTPQGSIQTAASGSIQTAASPPLESDALSGETKDDFDSELMMHVNNRIELIRALQELCRYSQLYVSKIKNALSTDLQMCLLNLSPMYQ